MRANLETERSPESIELPTPAPDPLRFVFPTAQIAPVSAWRPPLYPTPWAPSPYDHFYFARPIAADQINWPLQNYRYGGEFFQDVVHTGVDIPAPKGTPVLAAGSGKVVWAGYGVYRGGYDVTDPYGLAVTIRHDFGYLGDTLFTIYGHLDQVDVALGQIVQTGEPIGLVGETGRVTGPHLHFEVRLGENDFFATRNPELWIVPPVGWGVLAGRILDSSGSPVEAQPVVLTSLSTGQNWFSRSYGAESPVNADPYYQENLVIGDLPAGRYLVRISYAGVAFSGEVEVYPGQVSYFYFYGKGGVVIEAPPAPLAFSPEAPQSLDK
jgi:murein DD-endopeptidase MepM/ murein hydrolase activator NlpD